MPINQNRPTEKTAIHAFAALIDRHSHVAGKVDGDDDQGEDFYVHFVKNHERTGDSIWAQVKGGRSYKSGTGYRVPIEQHKDYWSKSNAPVFCVVQDPDTKELFYANATRQIRDADRENKKIASILIAKDTPLNDDTIASFIQEASEYIGEMGDLHKFLSRLSGERFDITDYVAYFVNLYGEPMVFRQPLNEERAMFYIRDLGLKPIYVKPDDLQFDGLARRYAHRSIPEGMRDAVAKTPMIGDIIISQTEALWLYICFQASEWTRSPTPKGRNDAQDNERVQVPPITYSVRQEMDVADKKWRQEPKFDPLMEEFRELGYEYWRDIASKYLKTPKPYRQRKIVWGDLLKTARQLRGLGVPRSYIMGNRGRLSRAETQQLFSEL